MTTLEVPLANHQETEFGRRLRAWRAHSGLSQRDLAARCGIHYVTVARLETGAVPEPAWGVALKLAGVLGVGIEAFTEGGPMPQMQTTDPPPQPKGKRKQGERA